MNFRIASLASLICLSTICPSMSGCSKPSEFNAVKVVQSDVELTVSSVTSGTVSAEKEAQLAFGAVGRVSTLKAQVGLMANAGDILAELENRDLRAALSHAEHDLRRAQSLTKSALMAEQENERARETYELALAAVEKSTIRAPFNGLVTEVNLEVGQLSQITAISPKALIRIVDLEPRYVSAEIDEVDLPKISKDMPARIKILAVRREPFRGIVRLVIPYVSAAREQDRTSLVELNIDSEGITLPSGASAEVEIIAAHRARALTIPSRALLGRGTDRYVFIEKNGRGKKVPITIGIGNYERTEITGGLELGDTVLIPSDKYDLIDDGVVKVQVVAWP